MMNVIGKSIKENRLYFKLNQKDLASIIEVSQTSICRWETGQRVPNIIEVLKLAQAFGISLDELVDL